MLGSYDAVRQRPPKRASAWSAALPELKLTIHGVECFTMQTYLPVQSYREHVDTARNGKICRYSYVSNNELFWNIGYRLWDHFRDGDSRFQFMFHIVHAELVQSNYDSNSYKYVEITARVRLERKSVRKVHWKSIRKVSFSSAENSSRGKTRWCRSGTVFKWARQISFRR